MTHPQPVRTDVSTRRRVVTAGTLVVGTALLWWSVQRPPGDDGFYAGTAVLAVIWFGGAVLAGPLRLGRARGAARGRPVARSLGLGLGLLAVFLVGALVVAQLPVLRDPVAGLLDHARHGSLALVVVITVVNGIAEELFFRGAFYSAIVPRHAVWVTTVVYALTTVPAGVPLLVLAAACVGLVCGLLRRTTGGVLGPIIAHVTWSTGMLLLLPLLLASGG